MDEVLKRISSIYRERGKRIYQAGYVYDVTITPPDLTGERYVKGSVESESNDSVYDVSFYVTKNGEMNVAECTCPFYEDRYTPCKHIAALAYAYVDEMKYNPVGFSDNGQKKLFTSNELVEFLNDYEKEADRSFGNIAIIPIINGFESSGALQVEFKIGDDRHTYVVKNIYTLLTDIQKEETVSYGKFLSFRHTLSAFTPQSQKLISFLNSLDDVDEKRGNISYYSYGYYYSPLSTRTLSLRGSNLDEFVECVKDGFVNFDTNKGLLRCTVEEGIAPISVNLEKKEGDCYEMESSRFVFGRGKNYVYTLNPKRKILFYQKADRNTKNFLEVLKGSASKPLIISEVDMPKFTKLIYPILSRNTNLKSDSYLPETYILESPTYELYLDAPQSDVITCNVKAVYSYGRFDLCVAEGETKRNFEEEKLFENTLVPFFTSYNEEDKAFSLHGDDDEIYEFLTDKIPQLYTLGTVFISDKLNRMRTMAAPKVTMGVSITHDLLQLNLVSDTLSMAEVAEVLSKYDRKKKFFRLKNGTFLNMKDSQMDEFLSMADNLSLSRSDVAKGKISLPKYRALYIDSLSENRNDAISYDDSFTDMIHKMKEVSEEAYTAPEDLNATLRPYQLDGMRWLCALRDNGFGGLLADDMGLGKTIQVISMLGNWKERKRTLIVAPASLVYNWAQEIDKFLPSLPHTIVVGLPDVRKQIIESAGEEDVLITSYQLLQRDIELYQDMHFSCQIIDEAQNIKNANTLTSKATKLIHADFKVALTGTPIENRLSELWSIFDYLMPGFFHGYDHFRKRYELPIMQQGDEESEKQLTAMISPFVLRRLKKDVLKDLPDKLEEIYYANMEGEQKALYDAEVQKIKLMLETSTEQEFKENKLVIIAELSKLRMLCCNPCLVYDKYKADSAKTDMCMELVKNAVEGGHKVLLFSQFTSMLAEIEKALQKEGMQYYLLEGSTPKQKRAMMVQQFQEDDVPLFLISLKAGGTGLNLTAADVVIHYDPWWNTAVENQASDRAHRIGQKNVVSVYKLIMKDTIEERIIELQKEKNDLANRILSGEGMSSAKLSREDLLALL